MTVVHVEGMPEAEPGTMQAAVFDIDGPLICPGIAHYSHASIAVQLAIRTQPDKCVALKELYENGDIWEHVDRVRSETHGNPKLEYDAMTYDGFWEETFAAVHPTIVKAFSISQYNPPGALMLLDDLCQTEIRTAAWTSRKWNILDPICAPLGDEPREPAKPRKHKLFDMIIAADDVGDDKLKPHPHGGELILNALGIADPSLAAFAGDQPSDMQAGRRVRVGKKVGMITWGIVDLSRGLQAKPVQYLIEAGACYVADSVADMRKFFELPDLPSEELELEARERELHASRQFYSPTLEERRDMGMVLTEAEYLEQMAMVGAYMRRQGLQKNQ